MKRIAIVVIALVAFCCAGLGAEGKTRLAIGTFGAKPEKRDADLADLTAARLSALPGFELVERRELDAVLKEASLSISGLVRAQEAVRFGKLLRADQFLLGSSISISGTNRLIIRLVNAQTGEIQAIGVIPDTGSVENVAAQIADFVRAEHEHPAQGQRNYLAIGVIQNLGVNNRFADFPAQMRGSVAAGLNGRVTVLERDVVSFLADEMRLDTMGLTERKGGLAPQMQFGFWIVDGFYQSYEMAAPEVQLKLRVERVFGGQEGFLLQGKPDETFFGKICQTIGQAISKPEAALSAVPPTRQGEIAALEARGSQLLDYKRTEQVLISEIWPRVAVNKDKILNTLDEAMRIYSSILLLDPENNAAKMRLAACLLFDTEHWGGVERGDWEGRKARATEYYREVIATSDPEYADDARIVLAGTYGGFKGVDMLRRFAVETTDPKAKANFTYFADLMLFQTDEPIDVMLPYLRTQILGELQDVADSTNATAIVSFDHALFAYRFNPTGREKIVNALLPEMLQKFPKLEPFILLAAAGEQTTSNAPVAAQFYASLKRCEEHPEAVWHAPTYFTHLSTTTEDEENIGKRGLLTLNERTFKNKQYATIVAEAEARRRAAEKGLAPPLTDSGKLRLGESYLALQRWKEAFDLLNESPLATEHEKNECRSHLGMITKSEELPDSAWKNESDSGKVKIAYECIARQQWATAVAILESMGHRTVCMSRGGAWADAFVPVLPAVVARECRIKAGMPERKDPMRFELGEKPYVAFTRDARWFSFEAEGEDLWLATFSEIKMFHGDGTYDAGSPAEMHELQRTTRNQNTCICVTRDYIWAGTFDDGIFELDRRTGTSRRLTMNDGLLLNGISGLKLEGTTLWIAYQNGNEGAVGTMDVASHKFSAFTASLPANTGTNSQSYHDQARLDDAHAAPHLPVTCMAELMPGEMWFAVADKGLQVFRSAQGDWQTLRPSSMTRGMPLYFSAMAVDKVHNLLLLAQHESNPLDWEKSVSGGLMIIDLTQRRQDMVQINQDLPSNEVTAVAADGKIAWVGGRGFVAVVDVAQRKVLKIAYVSAQRIWKIQLSPVHAWIQVSCGKDRDREYSGDAWTGVYRLDRAAIEGGVSTPNGK